MTLKFANGRVVVPFVTTDVVEQPDSDGQIVQQSYPSTRYVMLKERNRTWDQIYGHKAYLSARAQGTLQTTYASSSGFTQDPRWAQCVEIRYGMYYAYAKNRYVPGFTRCTTFIPLINTPSGDEWSHLQDLNALNIAKIAALNKLSDVKSMLLVDLAEAQKTHDMIAGRVKQLATALSKVKKGQFVAAGKILRMNKRQVKRAIRRASRKLAPNVSKGAKVWLEFRYGWMPLLHSIDDATKHLAYLMADPKIRSVTRSSHSSYTASRQESSKGSIATRVANSVKYGRNAEVKTETKVRFWVKVAPSSYELAQLNRGSFLNLTEVAWELVPLSFVVDWLTPIGDWLQSMSALAGLSVVDAGYSVSRTTTTTVGYALSYVGSDGYQGYVQGVPDEIKYEESSYTRFNRAQLESIGGILPSFPPVKIKLNGTRAADAFSLLWGAARAKFRH